MKFNSRGLHMKIEPKLKLYVNAAWVVMAVLSLPARSVAQLQPMYVPPMDNPTPVPNLYPDVSGNSIQAHTPRVVLNSADGLWYMIGHDRSNGTTNLDNGSGDYKYLGTNC